MVALKQLDFDYPFDVFAYRQNQDICPLAKLSALVAEDQSAYPARLRQYLPRFESLNAWRRNE